MFLNSPKGNSRQFLSFAVSVVFCLATCSDKFFSDVQKQPYDFSESHSDIMGSDVGPLSFSLFVTDHKTTHLSFVDFSVCATTWFMMPPKTCTAQGNKSVNFAAVQAK